MDVRPALRSQYEAQLAMLEECIRLCPADAWRAGEHPRAFWRIAYHALHFTHLYLMPTADDFRPWSKAVWHGPILWHDDERGDPPRGEALDPADLLEYAAWVRSNLREWIDALDLDSEESGFPWYPVSKLEHQLVNLRHLGTHIGQLQERLYALGLDPRWRGRGETS